MSYHSLRFPTTAPSVAIGAHRWLEKKHPRRDGWTARLSLESLEVDAWISYLKNMGVRTEAQERKYIWCNALAKAIVEERCYHDAIPHDDPSPPCTRGPLFNPPHIEQWIYDNYSI